VAEQAGAHVVVNRKTEDVAQRVRGATGGEGVARVVEVDVCANIETDLACLAPAGVIACYATAAADSRLDLPYLRAMAAGAVIRGVFVYVMPEQAHLDGAREVTACLRAGAYRPVIGRVLPLERIADAHVAQDDGSVIGKILLGMPA
jgi:NADPH:quinone reductase-like Zn-dependent oxidoreductase